MFFVLSKSTMATPERELPAPFKSPVIIPIDKELSIEALGEDWFGPKEINEPSQFHEHAVRIAALLGCDLDHPDVMDYLDAFARGEDRRGARTLVQMTLNTAYEEYEKAIDKTSGLMTYWAMEERLINIYGRSLAPEHKSENVSYPRSCSIYLGDIKRFKRVNDTLGHHIGDGLIAEMGDEVKGTLRPADKLYVARGYNKGDEVVVAVVGQDPTEVSGMTARLRREQQIKMAEGRQMLLWEQIETELAPYPTQEERFARTKCRIVPQHEGDKVVYARTLFINDKPFCRMRDLLVIDWGYATDVITSVKQIPELIKLADARMYEHKQQTNDQAGESDR